MTKEEQKQVYIRKYIFAEIHKKTKYFLKYPGAYIKIEIDIQFIRIALIVWGFYNNIIDIRYSNFDKDIEDFYNAVDDFKIVCENTYKY